ncbi:MAG: hypothetical protein EXQ74_00305 [Thermoleophilia bacterium]|nr:hypothetical protein [Thermoleophilia bacterium]
MIPVDDHRTDTATGSNPLLQRIAIAAGIAVLLGGTLIAGAAMGSMPRGIPGLYVSASPGAKVGMAVTPQSPRGPTATPRRKPTRVTLSSAYDASAGGNACSGFPQTRKGDLTMATDLVPCGARIRIFLMDGSKSVVVQRRDWGPLKGGRQVDLNLGAVVALGYSSLYQFGVRQVRWEPVAAPRRLRSARSASAAR